MIKRLWRIKMMQSWKKTWLYASPQRTVVQQFGHKKWNIWQSQWESWTWCWDKIATNHALKLISFARKSPRSLTSKLDLIIDKRSVTALNAHSTRYVVGKGRRFFWSKFVIQGYFCNFAVFQTTLIGHVQKIFPLRFRLASN